MDDSCVLCAASPWKVAKYDDELDNIAVLCGEAQRLSIEVFVMQKDITLDPELHEPGMMTDVDGLLMRCWIASSAQMNYARTIKNRILGLRYGNTHLLPSPPDRFCRSGFTADNNHLETSNRRWKGQLSRLQNNDPPPPFHIP